MVETKGVSSKMDMLVAMSQLQSRFGNALVEAETAKCANEPEKAIQHFERFRQSGLELLRLSELHNQHHPDPVDPVGTVNSLINGLSIYADVLQSSGDLKKSEDIRDSIASLAEQYLGPAGVAEMQRSRAASLIGQGRFNEGLTALAMARDRLRELGSTVDQIRISIDMADVFHWLGDLDRATHELQSAREAAAGELQGDSGSKQGLLSSLMADIGSIMSGKGDSGKAQRSAALFRISKELDFYDGLISRSRKDWDRAEVCFTKVLPDYTGLGVGEAIRYQFACLALGRGQFQKALEIVEEIEPAFESNAQFRPKLGALLKVKAEAFLGLGQLKEALDVFEKGAADIESTAFDPDMLWRLYDGKARVLEQLNRTEDALAACIAAAEIVEGLRKASLGYRLDNCYLRDKMALFHRAIGLCVRLNDVQQAIQLTEAIKSRTLSAVLATGRDRPESSALGKSFEDLSRQIDSLEYQGFHEGDSKKYRDQRQNLLLQRAEVLERLRFTDARWRTLTVSAPLNLASLQGQLVKTRQAVLSLFLMADTVVSIFVTPTSAIIQSVVLSLPVLEKLAGYTANLTAGSSADPSSYDPSGMAVQLGARHFVSEQLLENALQHDSLVISPHGALHLLPWAGLIYKKRRLFEYCPVSVVPNLNCMASLSTSIPSVPRAAVFGPPEYSDKVAVHLPSALEESANIAAIYKSKTQKQVQIATGADATGMQLLELLADKCVELIHISCHGVIESFEPMNSGLLMADTKVDAAEITQTRIAPCEVVLSACSTGWRPTTAQEHVELVGDDILGLPGAFMEAGVKVVLVSIPPADDKATAQLMQFYHGNRAAGLKPMKALQEAQKSMLALAEKPWKWVGFTLYGCQ